MPLTLLLLTISDRSVEASTIERKLDQAKDWLRYSPGCWLILTSRPAKLWYERVSSLPGMDESLAFVCEVNLTNKSGKLSAQAWTWLKDVQAKIAKEDQEGRDQWVRAAMSAEAEHKR